MFLKTAKEICKKIILKKNVDFLIIDFHGEITVKKMAMDIFLMVHPLVLWELILIFLQPIQEFLIKVQHTKQISECAEITIL